MNIFYLILYNKIFYPDFVYKACWLSKKKKKFA